MGQNIDGASERGVMFSLHCYWSAEIWKRKLRTMLIQHKRADFNWKYIVFIYVGLGQGTMIALMRIIKQN
jgi:hypothetical protein